MESAACSCAAGLLGFARAAAGGVSRFACAFSLGRAALGAQRGSLSFAAAPTARPEPAHRPLVAPLWGRDSDRHRTPAQASMADPRTPQPQLSRLPKYVA